MTPHPRARSLASLLDRDLGRLEAEVRAFRDDAALWVEAGGIANPGGTLALHLAGNLQHFVGAQIGDSGYVRDRPREFGARDLPRAELLAEITAARASLSSPHTKTSQSNSWLGSLRCSELMWCSAATRRVPSGK